MTRNLFTSVAMFFAVTTTFGFAEETKQKQANQALNEVMRIDLKVSALNKELEAADGNLRAVRSLSETTRQNIREENSRRVLVTTDAARIRRLDVSVSTAKTKRDFARNAYSAAMKDVGDNPMNVDKKEILAVAEKTFLDMAASLKEAESQYEKQLKQVTVGHAIRDNTADVPAELDALASQIERKIDELKAKDKTEELRDLRDERNTIAQEQMRLLALRNSIVQNETLQTIASVGLEVLETKKAILVLNASVVKLNAQVCDGYNQDTAILGQVTAMSLNIKEVHTADFPELLKKVDALTGALKQRLQSTDLGQQKPGEAPQQAQSTHPTTVPPRQSSGRN